ncbi:hypothetical protein [Bartonella sp. AA23NXGY]|uniref:hypothetical protein n=1 Tax=Bartonella sp. AA23NXGY TaxID=3243431 RepID=UPI0035CF81DE
MSQILALSATNGCSKALKKTNKVLANAMTVVFATYQLIQVIADAQEKYGLSEFDLIIYEAAQAKAVR